MIFGVDSHRSSLSLAGVDALGRVQVAASFGNRPSEHHKLARLVKRHGVELVGVEGSGNRGTEATLAAMDADSELLASPGTAAHLIHRSSEGRFAVTCSPSPRMSRAEIEGVDFGYLALADAVRRFRLDDASPSGLSRDIEGRPFTRIRQPGLGLWRAAS